MGAGLLYQDVFLNFLPVRVWDARRDAWLLGCPVECPAGYPEEGTGAQGYASGRVVWMSAGMSRRLDLRVAGVLDRLERWLGCCVASAAVW